MKKVDNKNSVRKSILLCMILLNAIILEQGFTNNKAIYWWLIITLPTLALTLFISQKKKAGTRKKNTENNAIQSLQTKNYA